MSNKFKIFISICIVAIVIAAVVFAKNRMAPEENVNVVAGNTTNTSVQNETEENTAVENTTIENTVDNNTVTENTNTEVQNSVVQDNIVSSPDKNAYESQSNVGSTNSKQQAIDLVKDYWGEDDSVTFSCDSVTSNGEYIIAVSSKTTASVQGYFRVNIEKKTVEVDY